MTALRNTSCAFIGAGAMGEAMIGGLLHHDLVAPEAVTASDPHESRRSAVELRFGVRTTGDNRGAARDAGLVVLSVKPQVLGAVCDADLSQAGSPYGSLVDVELDCGTGRPVEPFSPPDFHAVPAMSRWAQE